MLSSFHAPRPLKLTQPLRRRRAEGVASGSMRSPPLCAREKEMREREGDAHTMRRCWMRARFREWCSVEGLSVVAAVS